VRVFAVLGKTINCPLLGNYTRNLQHIEGEYIGILRGILWITAAAATGGLALALLPNDWDGIDGYDGGGDE
jgi:hypothetical protein